MGMGTACPQAAPLSPLPALGPHQRCLFFNFLLGERCYLLAELPHCLPPHPIASRRIPPHPAASHRIPPGASRSSAASSAPSHWHPRAVLGPLNGLSRTEPTLSCSPLTSFPPMGSKSTHTHPSSSPSSLWGCSGARFWWASGFLPLPDTGGESRGSGGLSPLLSKPFPTRRPSARAHQQSLTCPAAAAAVPAPR